MIGQSYLRVAIVQYGGWREPLELDLYLPKGQTVIYTLGARS